MSNEITCRVLLKNFNDIKNLTLGETAPDFEYKCTVYQYCCYNYTVPHSPWCCDANYTLRYKEWYLWVILTLITVLICALFFYFRFYQKRILERRIQRAKQELEAHYRPLNNQVAICTRDTEEDDKSWTTEDPPPCYADIMAAPPSYTSNKNLAATTSSSTRSGNSSAGSPAGASHVGTSVRHNGPSSSRDNEQESNYPRRQLPQIRNFSSGPSGSG